MAKLLVCEKPQRIAVVDAGIASACVMPDVDPILGVFARTGIVALNGVLDGQINVGEVVAVFGLGVIGQLVCTRGVQIRDTVFADQYRA